MNMQGQATMQHLTTHLQLSRPGECPPQDQWTPTTTTCDTSVQAFSILQKNEFLRWRAANTRKHWHASAGSQRVTLYAPEFVLVGCIVGVEISPSNYTIGVANFSSKRIDVLPLGKRENLEWSGSEMRNWFEAIQAKTKALPGLKKNVDIAMTLRER